MFIALSAQGQQKFTLSSAQEYALDHAYGVQIAKLEIDRAKQIYRQNLASGLPQASAQGQYAYNIELASLVADLDNDPSTLEKLTFGTDYQAQGGLVVTQLIFDGSYIVALQATRTYLELSKNAKEKTEIEIASGITSTYGMVLIAEKNLTILEGNITNLDKMLSDTKALYENGFAEEQDVEQLRFCLLYTSDAADE